MTPEQRTKCHVIIHSAASTAAAGNVVPVPGLGMAVDTLAMASMATALAVVLGGSITEEVGRAMSINALRHVILRHPVKMLAKELTKFVPLLGSAVAPTISAGMVEAAGWEIVRGLESGIADGSIARPMP